MGRRSNKEDARLRELIHGYYATGDEQLIGQLLEEIKGLQVSYIKGVLRVYDAALVREIISNTALSLLKKFRAQKIDPTQNFFAYVCVASRLELQEIYGCRARDPSTPGPGEDPFLLLPDELATPAESLPEDADDEGRAAATLALATRAMLGLDPNARACVHLHYYKSMPVAEAAKQLGISVDTFKDRLARGMDALRVWGQQNPGLALNQGEYGALSRVDTGQLFEDDDPGESRRLKKKAASAATQKSKQKKIKDVGAEQYRADQAAKEKERRRVKKGPHE